jgi:hypothetical protein
LLLKSEFEARDVAKISYRKKLHEDFLDPSMWLYYALGILNRICANRKFTDDRKLKAAKYGNILLNIYRSSMPPLKTYYLLLF